MRLVVGYVDQLAAGFAGRGAGSNPELCERLSHIWEQGAVAGGDDVFVAEDGAAAVEFA